MACHAIACSAVVRFSPSSPGQPGEGANFVFMHYTIFLYCRLFSEVLASYGILADTPQVIVSNPDMALEMSAGEPSGLSTWQTGDLRSETSEL